MEPDVSPTVPEETTEEMITISKSEYDNLCAPKPSFWTEALKNPEGTNGVKEFIQGILQTGLTLYGEKILKGQLIYSALRTILVIALLAGIVIISMILTTEGKLDAGAFTFLVGTITGYVLSYLTKTN